MKSKLEVEYEPEFNAWNANRDKRTAGALLKKVEPVVSNALRAYGGGPASPTLRSRAREEAVNAFNSYDPQKGTLRSHLLSRMQRIRRIAGKERQVIRVPEQVSLDQMRTNEAATALEERLGRPPSDKELADNTGLSVKRLGYIRRGVRPVAEGTITRMGPEGAGGYDPATKSLTDDDSWVEFIYEDMDPTNQFIMERSFGMHGNPRISATEIARQLRITPGAVSHRMQQIQAQIDELDDIGGV